MRKCEFVLLPPDAKQWQAVCCGQRNGIAGSTYMERECFVYMERECFVYMEGGCFVYMERECFV